ncbi:MAG: anion transporter, partial [Planctomycetota bacterium]
MDDADREIESSPPMGRFWIGVVLGPLLSLIVFLVLSRHAVESETATALSFEGRVVASVAVLMAVLWITEAIPIPATSLIPVALFPLLTGGRISIRTAAAPYAHELIFLFLGGF